RTSAQLEHQNIIPIYRVGQAGRVIYFVMKYLRGGSLASVLAERRTLSPPEIRRVLTEAGSGLGYAAQQGVVHRDIKPDNIMFDEFGQSYLTDFGIAKAVSGQRLTGTGMSIGTPHYMSPEQARAQTTDGRSDLYSLGIVAFQCLTGQVPYDGEDSFSIGYKHITAAIPTPSLASIDERRLFEVIRRMLAKDPDDRYQRFDDLLADLQADPIAPPGPLRVAPDKRQGGPTPTVLTPGIDPGPDRQTPARTTPARTTPVRATPARTTPIRATPARTTPVRATPAHPPRRIAYRSEAMRQSERPLWPWVAALVLVASAVSASSHFGNPVAPARAEAETHVPAAALTGDTVGTNVAPTSDG